MDVESLVVELFGLRLAEFTAARDGYVTEARKAGDRELAAAIAALRKPTVAAWTAGLLARRRPKEARSLVELGEALRAAHRTLDAGQLRQLSHDQHVVIQRLARTARTLAVEAGQAVSEPVLHEVEQILHAVLADPGVAAQWMSGRLAKAPDAALGFTGLELAPGAAPAKEEVRRPDPDAGGRVVQARRERARAARAEAAETAAEAERLEAELAVAQEVADHAGADVAAAEEEVRAAGERLETVGAAGADAAARLKEAGRAAAKARARAETAARKAGKLTGSEG
ncbi:hypothetical protein ACFXPI_12175 [Streptomyces sp. NPDC059104]|uniref:hypothetical protein n=1 Tax=Streptomyces sp. NPDC059104 TaxID=3346729 RepID=UPI0036A38325